MRSWWCGLGASWSHRWRDAHQGWPLHAHYSVPASSHPGGRSTPPAAAVVGAWTSLPAPPTTLALSAELACWFTAGAASCSSGRGGAKKDWVGAATVRVKGS
eukprot:1153509-Pelagomonas_calceolata.AAC.3